MTQPIAKEKGLDPLAHAAGEPDVAALTTEFTLAQEWGPSQQDLYGLATSTRFNRWHGQTTDGLKWQKFQEGRTVVRPYDGRPDTRQHLVDGVIGALVDIDMVSLWGARIKPSPTHANRLTAAQSAELRSVVRWMMEGPLRGDLIDGAEYLSQMKHTLGWCVLHPTWQVRHGLRRQQLTLADLMTMAMKAPEGSLLRELPGMILGSGVSGMGSGEGVSGEARETAGETPAPLNSETGETPAPLEPELDAAVEMLRQVFPYLKERTAQRIVRELREEGETEFLYRETQENRQRLKVLVPGIDVFLPEEVQDGRDARAWFVREFYSESDVLAKPVNDEWHEDFAEAAAGTAGQVSFADQDITEQMRDKNNRRIEVVTAYVKQTDDDGIQAVYYTEFSAFVPELWGSYGLLEDPSGQYPFIIVRTEVIGPSPDDSRGVPYVLRTQQWELKRQRDALHILAELRTNPPRLRIGMGWSKTQESFAPGSDITNSIQGSTLKYLEPPNDNGSLAVELCELIRSESEDHYGLPRSKTESHPTRWQARQTRSTTRWLLGWSQAIWHLVLLVYYKYTKEELAELIGRAPSLTVETLKKFQLNFDFDARTMDPEFLQLVLEQVGQVRQWNTGGTLDDNKLVTFALAALDPTLADEVTRDQPGAAQAIYKDVEHTLMSIMQGNQPQLAENDPTAGMKLKMAQQMIAQNPEYQMALMKKLPNGKQNPQFNPNKAKAVETWFKNLQHNQQETQVSPMQGRLGVRDIGQAPVQQGAGGQG